ncbi:MAG: PD-(D/E)XK nuclease family transposase [Selenomonadaceae bacterium]|nr:PD-(D/E)XK nuclease family transposase [Selenomonadaceae bacterium]
MTVDNWHSCFGIYDIETNRQLTDDLEMHFIELTKWDIKKDIKDMSTLEHWVSYFDGKTKANVALMLTKYNIE